MSQQRFDPDGIRRMGAAHARRSGEAVSAAQAAARASASITLPAFAAEQQGRLNDVLARLPSAMNVLGEMALGFQQRAARSADAYERTEAANTRAADDVGREL